MSRREPPGVAMLAARLARAFTALSAYSAAVLATELCAIERAQRRHAERCCCGEDGGYVRIVGRCAGCGEDWPCSVDGNRAAYRPDIAAAHHYASRRVHDPEAEERAGKRIQRRLQRLQELHSFGAILEHDPRGRVLLIQLPGDAEAVAV
jgi:hypothetical protein